MKTRKLAIAVLSCFAVAATSFAGSAFAADQTFITIGTGGVTGVYYPMGGAICRLVNKKKKETGIRCSVESTGGTQYNLNSIAAGELDMGVAQSDGQDFAYNGTHQFTDAGPNKELRSLFSLYPEVFTVVARKDSGITNYEQLKNKRFNIGSPGSGTRGNVDMVDSFFGWTTDDFSLASELKSAEQPSALCDNKIDAMSFTVGQPNGTIKEATTACDAVIVNVNGPLVEKMLEKYPYYAKAIIPAGMYRGTDTDTESFGVLATIVTTTKLPDEVAYQVVKAVFENFDKFKKMHPALSNLKKEDMVNQGLTAPLHPGAVKYYKEVGLLK